MVSCRRRRPSMSPLSWSRCVRPRVAVVLFNLGGPDRPEAIRPFLLNLFNDPARAVLRPALARAPDRCVASGAGAGQLQALGRSLTVAAIDRRTGCCAGS